MENKQNLIIFPENNPIYLQIFHNQYPSEHWHLDFELIFVLTGSLTLFIDDQTYNLLSEDVCLINPNTTHKISGPTFTILSLAFNSNDYDLAEHNNPLYFNLNSSGETSSPRYDYVRHLIAQLVKVRASNENKFMTLSLIYNLLGHLSDSFLGTPTAQMAIPAQNRERFIPILSYIHEHYQSQLTLNQVAEQFSFSPTYFATYFKKVTGMTFLNYYNHYRLSHSVQQLLHTEMPLESIATSHGFPDYRAFINVFKKEYQQLPSQYRKDAKNNQDFIQEFKQSPSLNPETDDHLKALAKYLTIYQTNESLNKQDPSQQLHLDGGVIDYTQPGIGLKHNYKKLCCVGSAKQFLYSEVQDMLHMVQKTIGYEYVKFHGILSDEMMVYTEKPDGTPVYSYTLMNKVLDFIISIGLKPLMQLSFMPVMLASNPEKMIDMWHFNTSPPKDTKKWVALIQSVITHLINRYGFETVKTWPFCVWNEPDGSVESFGWEKTKVFFDFYKQTYHAVKAIHPEIAFGTPSLLLVFPQHNGWTNDFLDYCKSHDCMPDFINIHYYDNAFSTDSVTVADTFNLDNMTQACPLNEDPFAFTKFISDLKQFQKKEGLDHLPVFLTEWNLTVSQRDLINDTCFKACYLTKNLLENYDRLHSFGYWCLTDFIQELQLPNELYHGGLGMFTYNGIPKAHYNTFYFLTQLGNELIAKGNGYFVTKTQDKIVMILYNYEHYSKLFASGILFDMQKHNRYAPFTQMNPVGFHMRFIHLPSVGCLVKEMTINQSTGSSYDAWAKMGSKENLSKTMLDSLKQVSSPGISLHYEPIHNRELVLNITMEPLEVRLVEITLDTSFIDYSIT